MTRRGMLLLELIVAAVLLSAFATVCVHYFAVAAVQRRVLVQRQTALQEAANVMEQLASLAWSDLTAERVSKISLAPEIQKYLPEAALKIELAEEKAGPPAKRITVLIRWKAQNNLWLQPVRLVAWRYAP
ncbi:MAG: type IV pilus modification PilV family protein [Thermoguttaceae bacterium]